VRFVGAQQLAKDVGQDPAVAVVRRLDRGQQPVDPEGGCGDRGHVPHSDTPHTLISRSGRDLGLTSPGAAAGVLGQWGPGREVRRNGVEVATAAGSLTMDSTSAISWSPNFLLLVRVVRRCERHPEASIDGEPDRGPVSVLTQVIQLGTAVPSQLVRGRLDQARRYCIAGLRCHPEIMEISRVWSSL